MDASFVTTFSLSTEPKGLTELFWKSKNKEEKPNFFSSQLTKNYKRTEKYTESKKMIENRRRQKLSKFYPKHSNRVYWVPLPNNLSCPSEENKIPVCLGSKQSETSFNLVTWYLRLFGQPYWHGFWRDHIYRWALYQHHFFFKVYVS